MNNYVSFNDLLKDCIERIDKRFKKSNPDRVKTEAYKQYKKNMRELFNDQSMFKNN